MNINLTPLIQAIIAVLAALITYKLIPWIKSRTTAQQQGNLQALIRVLVYAAEQIYGAGNGPEKLDYVCAELRERGYEVDLSAIEAAVYEAFNYDSLILRPGSDEKKEDEPEQKPEEAADQTDEAEIETGRVSDEPPSGAAEGRDE